MSDSGQLIFDWKNFTDDDVVDGGADTLRCVFVWFFDKFKLNMYMFNVPIGSKAENPTERVAIDIALKRAINKLNRE